MESSMSKMNAAYSEPIIDNSKVTFRGYQRDADYPLILSIILKSAQTDQVIETASLEDIKNWCAPSDRFDSTQDISFAVLENKGGEPSVIGFSRVSWYTGMKATRLYTQASYLLPEGRDQGIWPVMVRQNESRLTITSQIPWSLPSGSR